MRVTKRQLISNEKEENPKKKQKSEALYDKPKNDIAPYAKYETQQFTKKFTPYNYIDHFLNNYSHLIKIFPYKKSRTAGNISL